MNQGKIKREDPLFKKFDVVDAPELKIYNLTIADIQPTLKCIGGYLYSFKERPGYGIGQSYLKLSDNQMVIEIPAAITNQLTLF